MIEKLCKDIGNTDRGIRGISLMTFVTNVIKGWFMFIIILLCWYPEFGKVEGVWNSLSIFGILISQFVLTVREGSSSKREFIFIYHMCAIILCMVDALYFVLLFQEFIVKDPPDPLFMFRPVRFSCSQIERCNKYTWQFTLAIISKLLILMNRLITMISMLHLRRVNKRWRMLNHYLLKQQNDLLGKSSPEIAKDYFKLPKILTAIDDCTDEEYTEVTKRYKIKKD